MSITREEIVADLENVALVTALEKPRRPEPPTGSDGEQSCRECPKLRERIGEYKAADELVRHGPFTQDGAQVVRHLVTVARAARSNGREKYPLERKEVARLALGASGLTAEKAVSRALQAYKVYQDDPELAASLPYRVEWRGAGRKTHIDLVPLTPDTPRSTADEYRVLAHLPRDRKPAARVLDRDDSCVRCHSPEGVAARGTRRCLNEACGHTWHTRSVILGRTVARAEPAEPVQTAIPLLVGALPGQFVPDSTSTEPGQIVPANHGRPVNLMPVSFVSRAQLEAVAGPHYLGEAPPTEPAPWEPPPVAPPEHVARAFRRPAQVSAVAGGSE
jgi:hypothetical protein